MDNKIGSDFYEHVAFTSDNLSRCYVSLITVVMHFKGVSHLLLPPPDYKGDKYKWIDLKVREILEEERNKG